MSSVARTPLPLYDLLIYIAPPLILRPRSSLVSFPTGKSIHKRFVYWILADACWFDRVANLIMVRIILPYDKVSINKLKIALLVMVAEQKLDVLDTPHEVN